MAGARAVRVSEGTSPFAMAQWALAMTRVNGENGLTCGVPVADFAVDWDEERSEQMFKYIIEDDTSSIPKSLCTPTGFPADRHSQSTPPISFDRPTNSATTTSSTVTVTS